MKKEPMVPNLHIKPSLNSEIDAWVAEGNAIKMIQNKYQQRCKNKSSSKVNVVDLETEQQALKRVKQIENQATTAQIKQLSTWLNAQKGRAKALVALLGCANSDISQIKNLTRTCSKRKFEHIKQAMKTVEEGEKHDQTQSDCALRPSRLT